MQVLLPESANMTNKPAISRQRGKIEIVESEWNKQGRDDEADGGVGNESARTKRGDVLNRQVAETKISVSLMASNCQLTK
jgi:hypothetical protein